jgi:hypothetical protein
MRLLSLRRPMRAIAPPALEDVVDELWPRVLLTSGTDRLTSVG